MRGGVCSMENSGFTGSPMSMSKANCLVRLFGDLLHQVEKQITARVFHNPDKSRIARAQIRRTIMPK